MPSQPTRPPATQGVTRSEAKPGDTTSGGLQTPKRTRPRDPDAASLHGLQRVAGTSQTSHERLRKKAPPEPWGLESSLGQANLLLFQCPRVAKP